MITTKHFRARVAGQVWDVTYDPRKWRDRRYTKREAIESVLIDGKWAHLDRDSQGFLENLIGEHIREGKLPDVYVVRENPSRKRASRSNPSSASIWRARQIILEPELVARLYDWHGGQSSYVYSLASTGHEHLVSLSMIDAALDELRHISVRAKHPLDAKSKKHLKHTIGELATVRQFWRESSAQEAGLDEPIEGYDRRNYGLTAAEEASIKTRSG